MVIILFLFILAAMCFVIVKFIEQKEKDKEEKITQERHEQVEQKMLVAEKEYEKLLAALSVKFGECTINEEWNMDADTYSGQEMLSSSVLVYEQSEIIIIKSKEYKFADILGYSIVDTATNETISTSTGTAKMSTGSMLGRTIVGGVLAGGLGAAAGAVTADRDISDITTSETTTSHDYTLYINVNDLHEPIICLCIGFYAPIANKIAGILNIIIERNKQKKANTH